MNERTKLTAAVRKTLPKHVAAKVVALQKRYRTTKATLTVHDTDWQMYIAEGASYNVFHVGTGKDTSFTAMSERTLHAGGSPISYAVGQRCPAFPAGTFVVEFELFLGKPVIDVHQVVGETIEADVKVKPEMEVIF